ncbi:MAG TPA: hypothetical protein VEB20_16015 [Azospirillaceae bacterium]|nr:hypothetical protein [Azospirillaceae bacterium]
MLRKLSSVIALALCCLFPVPDAAAMDVATMLGKVEAVRGSGPFAMFSSDMRLLSGEVKVAGQALKEERLAAVAAGRTPAYCPPESGGSITQDDVLESLQAVPPEERSRTELKDALRARLARKFPCPS